jgi:hypothetical protein
MSSPLKIIMVCTLVSGCGRSGDPAAHRPTFHLEDSVPVVTLTEEQLSNAQQLTLRELQRSSVHADAPEDVLPRITRIVPALNGNVIVFSVTHPTVVVADSSGAVLRTIARKGRGPGELTFPEAIAVVGDSVVVLQDQTLHIFSGAGTFIRQVRLDSMPNRHHALQGRLHEFVNTSLGLAVSHIYSQLGSPNDDLGPRVDSIGARFISPQGGRFDRFATTRAGSTWFPRGPFRSPTLLGPRPEMAIVPDGHLVYTPGAEYVLEMIFQGRTVRYIVGMVPRVRLKTTDFEGAFRRAKDYLEATPSMKDLVPEFSRVTASVPRAEYRPALGRIIAGADDAFRSSVILVERPDLGTMDIDRQLTMQATQWDMMAVTGHYIGRLKLPAGFWLLAYHNSHILGVRKDAQDILHLSAFAVCCISPAKTTNSQRDD